MLKLYYHPRSTFSRRVRVALLEKGVEHELVEVDLAAGAHKSPAYATLNPYLRVPSIDDEGFVLYESAAILTYLEATCPAVPLIPVDARGRASVDMHLRLCDGQLGRHAGVILFPRRFLPQERWDLAAMGVARQEIAKHFEIVAAQLGERQYLVGDDFTLADIAYLPFLHFLPLFEIPVGPRVTGWAQRVLARPSAQATIPSA
jgi:glutathione S-transferase